LLNRMMQLGAMYEGDPEDLRRLGRVRALYVAYGARGHGASVATFGNRERFSMRLDRWDILDELTRPIATPVLVGALFNYRGAPPGFRPDGDRR
jgi:hypothetical protein